MPRRKNIKTQKQVTAPRRLVLREVTEEEITAIRQREQVMFAGVGLVMLAVLVVWVVNIKTSVSAVKFESDFFENLSTKNLEAAETLGKTESLLAQLKEAAKLEIASSSQLTEPESITDPALIDQTYNTNIGALSAAVMKSLNTSSTTINN